MTIGLTNNLMVFYAPSKLKTFPDCQQLKNFDIVNPTLSRGANNPSANVRSQNTPITTELRTRKTATISVNFDKSQQRRGPSHQSNTVKCNFHLIHELSHLKILLKYRKDDFMKLPRAITQSQVISPSPNPLETARKRTSLYPHSFLYSQTSREELKNCHSHQIQVSTKHL